MHIEYKKQHKRHKYYKYKYFCSPTLCLVRQNDHSLDPIVKTNAILIQKHVEIQQKYKYNSCGPPVSLMSLDPNVYKIRMYTTIRVLSDKIRMYKKETQVHNYVNYLQIPCLISFIFPDMIYTNTFSQEQKKTSALRIICLMKIGSIFEA